jgi:putative transposase
MLTHRRRSKKPGHYGERLETVAWAPNQVWCWDITTLPTLIIGAYYRLYVLQDIFSRKIVGHIVAEKEDAQVAIALMKQALENEQISGDGLRTHSDNGHPMKSYTLVEWLKSIGVLQSRSRPHVSDDNAFIESLFKTLKYAPQYPNRPFQDLSAANTWADAFVAWYNNEHMHSGIEYVTPSERHSGHHIAKLASRAEVFKQAQQNRPERWSRAPKAWEPATFVELSAAGCRAIK